MSEADSIEERHTPRWYQFTIRRVLSATLWAATGLGLFYAVMEPSDFSTFISQHRSIKTTLMVAALATPFVAVGTLFGHAKRGLVAGLVIAGGFAIGLYMAFNNGWINP